MTDIFSWLSPALNVIAWTIAFRLSATVVPIGVLYVVVAARIASAAIPDNELRRRIGLYLDRVV